MDKDYFGKTYIYIGKTKLSKTELLKLFDFYEIPDENGLTYDDDNTESWFTKHLNLKPYDEDFLYIEYCNNTTLKKILTDVKYLFEYDIPQDILNDNNQIDFIICANEKSDIEITEKNYQYKDENITIKYVGVFDSYIV